MRDPRENRFVTWGDFAAAYPDEVRHAREVYDALEAAGLKSGRLCTIDFSFVSDRREALDELRAFLAAHYPYEELEVTTEDGALELRGFTDPIAITPDHLLYWALDMAKRGYEFDARLDGYGSLLGREKAEFADLVPDTEAAWLDRGIEQYAGGNLSGAFVSWSHVIAINPRNADAYASRAIVRTELHAWRAALADYDAALAIAPGNARALLNRGAVRDDHGDHAGAIADYDQLLALGGNAVGDDDRANAYLNRGNSKLSLGDRPGACADWRRALALGAEAARIRIEEQCGARTPDR